MGYATIGQKRAYERSWYSANKERLCARKKAWREANPTKRKATQRRARLREKYDITPERYSDMLRQQLGLCACCKRAMDQPHIDHDHTTGTVRALLCGPCNIGIGNLGDSISRLEQALAYLSGHSRA